MKLKMMSPDDIMTIVVAIIIFSIGVYAFFTVVSSLPVSNWSAAGHQNAIVNATYFAMRNTSTVGNNVFNIVGVVLIVGAILIIVGIVYSYIRPRGF